MVDRYAEERSSVAAKLGWVHGLQYIEVAGAAKYR